MKNTSLTGVGLLAGFNAFANTVFKEENTITILHTNDMNGHLQSFPENDKYYAGLGGAAARAAIIQQIKKETKHVLLFDGGDIFQNNPLFSIFKGEPEIKTMNTMGYDAATLGENDFNGGLNNLAERISQASFPFVNCNYSFQQTALENKCLPYTKFKKANLTIGVLGVGIDLKGLVDEDISNAIVYKEPVSHANAVADYLKKDGCDMIICLSHLGDFYYDNKISDQILAQENFNIDLIISAHTHRFFAKPKVYKNKSGGNTIVNQMGWGGIHLGRLDYTFEGKQKKISSKTHTVVIREKTSE